MGTGKRWGQGKRISNAGDRKESVWVWGVEALGTGKESFIGVGVGIGID
jgi:hypothetical protein